MQVKFVAQVWINDYAITIDPLGPDTFDVGDIPPNVESNTAESDKYAAHPNAPGWVQDWQGPFYIEINRD